MKSKFLFGIILVAAILAGMEIISRKKNALPLPPAVVAKQETNTVTLTLPKPPVQTLAPARQTPSPEEQQAAIDAEKNRLEDWAMQNDDQSLSNILVDLNSQQKDIRMAAVEAAKQFGSSNAAPALKAAAANAPDTDEAIAMLEAADFVSLPDATIPQKIDPSTLTPEQQKNIEAAKARAEARRQATLQKKLQSPGQPNSGASPASQDPASSPMTQTGN